RRDESLPGAPLPSGMDAVVMVEHVERTGAEIRLAAGRSLKPGENVVPRGAEARAGDLALGVGTAMGAAEIALAASCGCAALQVFVRPRVAIVATGDELVEVDQVPLDWQIRNSNSYALKTLVDGAGGIGERLEVARDVRADVR